MKRRAPTKILREGYRRIGGMGRPKRRPVTARILRNMWVISAGSSNLRFPSDAAVSGAVYKVFAPRKADARKKMKVGVLRMQSANARKAGPMERNRRTRHEGRDARRTRKISGGQAAELSALGNLWIQCQIDTQKEISEIKGNSRRITGGRKRAYETGDVHAGGPALVAVSGSP